MDYDLKKQAMIQKTIDMDEIEILRAPNAMEIDNLRIEEAHILKQINESQMDLKMDMAFDDYWLIYTHARSLKNQSLNKK